MAERVDRHVGAQIRLCRAQRGLTQGELAVALGVSFQQMHKYEIGTNRISPGRLFEVARCLGVSVTDFFPGLGGGSPRADLPHGGRQRAVIELVRNFSAIADPEIRAGLLQAVRAVARRGRD